MNRRGFFRRLPSSFSRENVERIKVAYWLAKETHRGQKRTTGERYFEHCRRVALAGCNTPNEVIIALLHDVVEDGHIPQFVLRKLFGQYVEQSVTTLSKKVPAYDKAAGYITSKRAKRKSSYFHGIARADHAVRHIKCVDRIDNIKDMGRWSLAKKKGYCRETRRYVLPIAKRTDQRLYEELVRIIASHGVRVPKQ